MKMERASHGRRGRTSMRMEVDSSPEREIPGSISTRRVRLPSASKQQQQLQTPVTRPVPARIDTSSLNESEAGRTTYFASHSDAQGSTGDDDSSTEEEAEPADLVRKSPLLRADSIQEVNLSGRGARVLVERSRRSSSALFPDSPSTLSQYLLRSPSPGASSKRPATHSMHTAGHAHTAQVPCSPRAFNTPIHGGGRRFRLDILCEVLILTSAMSLAAFRISSLPISDIIPPAAPLITLTLLMPFITLFRRSAPSTHLMVPFTDERGYRDRNAADDGFPSGVGLPVLLAAGTVWDARVAVQKGQYLQLEGITLLTDIWSSTNPTPSDSPAKILLDARIALLCLTTLNVFVLILHLFLSRTVLRVNWLPLSNTRRFFGALTLSSTLSLLGGAITALFRHFGQASPYVNPLELAISSFIFQMSLYLVSRFARRAFTLGELAMTTATGVSLALEFWRVTRARVSSLSYSFMLLTIHMLCACPVALQQSVPPPRHLPFPNPAHPLPGGSHPWLLSHRLLAIPPARAQSPHRFQTILPSAMASGERPQPQAAGCRLAVRHMRHCCALPRRMDCLATSQRTHVALVLGGQVRSVRRRWRQRHARRTQRVDKLQTAGTDRLLARCPLLRRRWLAASHRSHQTSHGHARLQRQRICFQRG